ncbi:unnamed protein product, partial [Effrenium voratum]
QLWCPGHWLLGGLPHPHGGLVSGRRCGSAEAQYRRVPGGRRHQAFRGPFHFRAGVYLGPWRAWTAGAWTGQGERT